MKNKIIFVFFLLVWLFFCLISVYGSEKVILHAVILSGTQNLPPYFWNYFPSVQPYLLKAWDSLNIKIEANDYNTWDTLYFSISADTWFVFPVTWQIFPGEYINFVYVSKDTYKWWDNINISISDWKIEWNQTLQLRVYNY